MPATTPIIEALAEQDAALTAWTTHDELTPEQRASFGEYVAAKDEFRARAEANQRAQERTRAIMDACGGDKGRALAMALRGAV